MKYNIEGEIDFYKELNNFTNEVNEVKEVNKVKEVNNDINKCLITYEELTSDFVELGCGHKFNYGPLYKDIYNYKKKYNNMEQMYNRLKTNEIRCPYCRKIQIGLLPYLENLPYPKEHGINFIDTNKTNNNYCISSNNQCQYEKIVTDASGNTFVQKCFNYGMTQLKLKEKYNITTKYCYQHKSVVLFELKEKEKLKIFLEKIKIKEEKKKLKEEKKKLEKEKKKLEKENKINNSEGCKAILKTGNRKGCMCQATIFNNNFCKRHIPKV
jgi:hypothetical protein